MLEAAAEVGVKRVVYVSSVAAVGHDGQLLSEEHWNDDLQNPYYRSKILSERAAWQMAQAHGLWMVSVLPSAMIGPHASRLTDTMGFLASIEQRKIPLDPNFHFNFVDVRDVAQGLILAAEKGARRSPQLGVCIPEDVAIDARSLISGPLRGPTGRCGVPTSPLATISPD